MDKLDAAIGIYKYGIKNVSVADENFKVSTSNVEWQRASTRLDISQRAKLRLIQLLQGIHDKLTRQLSPPKAIDPFVILPIELVEMIISYLTFRNIVYVYQLCLFSLLKFCPNLIPFMLRTGLGHVFGYQSNGTVFSSPVHHFGSIQTSPTPRDKSPQNLYETAYGDLNIR